jgi:NAD(P)-dependent dehydrogenase (short-subunit alcohol dehydrogenase family)
MSDGVVIITGAGRGIGRATAVVFAERGWSVVLVGRTESSLHDTATMLPPDRTLVAAGDVGDSTRMAAIVRLTAGRFGRIDAVVNNAGLAPVQSIEQTDDATWQQVMDTNLNGAFYLARESWPELRKSGGAVVNISSEAARDPLPGFVAYAPAKAALNMLTLMLHREGKSVGVRAYTVAPSATETPMFRAILSEAEYSKDNTLDPAQVARVIYQCVAGDLRCASGEVIYVHRR